MDEHVASIKQARGWGRARVARGCCELPPQRAVLALAYAVLHSVAFQEIEVLLVVRTPLVLTRRSAAVTLHSFSTARTTVATLSRTAARAAIRLWR